ncbi:MAG: FAD-dependent oxidoreductase, partial [Planctomycetota bacterium]|nr:FAD-dependent oxidoreductase [Planctomycetota bacterium]
KGWWLDTDRAELRGVWLPSRSVDGFVGNNYLHDADQGKGQATARYIFSKLPEGLYSVRFAYTPHQNRASNVPVTVTVGEVPSSILVNQKAPPTLEQAFIEIGQYEVEKDGRIEVRVSNESTDGFVVVDAIWILPVRPKP